MTVYESKTDPECSSCGHPESVHDEEHYANLCAGFCAAAAGRIPDHIGFRVLGHGHADAGPRRELLCVGCKHFVISLGTRDWSTRTPGDPPEVRCKQGHFSYERDEGLGAQEFRKVLDLAKTCGDFAWQDQPLSPRGEEASP